MFSLNERHKVQMRGGFFNFPNHPNWNNPTNGSFGNVTSKNSERNVGLRYSSYTMQRNWGG